MSTAAGVANSNPLKGRINMDKCSAGRRLKKDPPEYDNHKRRLNPYEQ